MCAGEFHLSQYQLTVVLSVSNTMKLVFLEF